MKRHIKIGLLVILLAGEAAAQTYSNSCVQQQASSSVACTIAGVTAGQSAVIFSVDPWDTTGTPSPAPVLTDSGTSSAIALVQLTHPPGSQNWESLWVVTNLGAGSHTFSITTPGSSGNAGAIEAVTVAGASTANPVDNFNFGYQANNYQSTVGTSATVGSQLVLAFNDGGGVASVTATPAMTAALSPSGSNTTLSAYYGTTSGAGTTSFAAAYDNNGYTASALITLTATALSLATTTASLPAAQSTVTYSTQLQAHGGTLPYASWTLTSGTLPPGLRLSTSGLISGTPTTNGTYSGLVFQVTDGASNTASTPGLSITVSNPPPSITTTSCAGGTQYTSYAGCTMTATAGNPPYTWSAIAPGTYQVANVLDPLPEGLSIDPSTGVISGTIMGMGIYQTALTVTDSAGLTARQPISFAIKGDTRFLEANPFPSDSIWALHVANLPVDTTTLGVPLPSESIHVVFGAYVQDGGIPVINVPSDQALAGASVLDGGYQMFTQAPYPPDTPVENGGTECEQNGGGSDCHTAVIQMDSAGTAPASGWEMWQASETSPTSWTSGSSGTPGSQGQYLFSGYGMYTQDNGEGVDAAGLPLAPLLLNFDAVTSPGGQKGVVRFTVQQAYALACHVAPATAQAGGGKCTGGYEDDNKLVSQLNPPTSPDLTRIPFGEIYRIRASVYASPPSCFTDGNHPEAASILRTLRNYGMIFADNGGAFIGLIGTPDARWNDTDLQCLTSLSGSSFEPVMVQQVMKDWPGTSVDHPFQGTSQVTPSAREGMAGRISVTGNIRIQ